MLFSHPGGVEIVTDLAGQDATADYDDVGHTQEAHEILEKFLIGHLKAGVPVSGGSAPAPVAAKKEEPKAVSVSAPTPVQVKPAPQTVKPKAPMPQEEDSSMMIMAGVAVAAVAAGFLLYKRSLKA